MYQDFKCRYKITNEKNPYDRIVEKYKLLSSDPSFLEESLRLGELVYKKFNDKYPDIQLDFRFRKKSQRSIEGKVLKHELNRIGLLSMIRELSQEEASYFDELISKKFDFNNYNNLDKKYVLMNLNSINELSVEQLENLQQYFLSDKFDSEVKKMLLRNLRFKILNSNRENKEEELKKFDEKFIKSDDDYLKVSDLKTMSKEIREKLEKPNEYSKIYDIMGMKGIIGEIPKGFESDNEIINRLLRYRKTSKYSQDIYSRIILEDELAIEIGKVFLKEILEDEEVLKNFHSIEERRKSILKENGYRAEHATVNFNSNPYKTIEMQFKSKYRERIAKEGTAAHDQRDGKNRSMPELPVDERFISELKYRVPKYYVIRFGDKKLYECGLFENTCYYYAKQINNDKDLFMQLYNSNLMKEDKVRMGNER